MAPPIDFTPPGPVRNAKAKAVRRRDRADLATTNGRRPRIDPDHPLCRRLVGYTDHRLHRTRHDLHESQAGERSDLPVRPRCTRQGRQHLADRSSSPATPVALLLASPSPGAKVAKPPVLRWASVRSAAYFNVQLYRGGQKILSAWPVASRLALKGKWTYEKRKYTPQARCVHVVRLAGNRRHDRPPSTARCSARAASRFSSHASDRRTDAAKTLRGLAQQSQARRIDGRATSSSRRCIVPSTRIRSQGTSRPRRPQSGRPAGSRRRNRCRARRAHSPGRADAPRPATKRPTSSAAHERGVADSGLNELEETLRARRQDRRRGRPDDGRERSRAIAPAERTRAKRTEIAQRREAREASPEHDGLVGREVRVAELGRRCSLRCRPDRRDREMPRWSARRQQSRGRADVDEPDLPNARLACATSLAMSTSSPRARITSPSFTTPACRTGSRRSSATMSAFGRGCLDRRLPGTAHRRRVPGPVVRERRAAPPRSRRTRRRPRRRRRRRRAHRAPRGASCERGLIEDVDARARLGEAEEHVARRSDSPSRSRAMPGRSGRSCTRETRSRR